MTPYEMGLLIHFHTTPAKYEHDQNELYKATVNTFKAWGVIQDDPDYDSGVCMTNYGRAWLSEALATPYPKTIYQNRYGDEITTL